MIETLDKQYQIDGKLYDRVTTVLKSVGLIDYSAAPASAMEYGMDRGSKVHRAAELFDLGTLDEESLDPVLKPYLDSYKKFLADTRFSFEVSGIEMRVHSTELMVAGTLDRLGNLNGRRAIVDLKTTQIPDWTAIQTALYGLCLPFMFHEFDRYGLALRNDGTYRLEKFQDRRDRDVALSAVAVHHFKTRR